MLNELAEATLWASQTVIVDATHRRSDRRGGSTPGLFFFGLWLEAPIGVLVRCVTNRRRDASDTMAGIVAVEAKLLTGILIGVG